MTVRYQFQKGSKGLPRPRANLLYLRCLSGKQDLRYQDLQESPGRPEIQHLRMWGTVDMAEEVSLAG